MNRTKKWLCKLFKRPNGLLCNYEQYFEINEDGMIESVNNENISILCSCLKLSVLIRNNINVNQTVQHYTNFVQEVFSQEHIQTMRESEQVQSILVHEITEVGHKIFQRSPHQTAYKRWFDSVFCRFFIFRTINQAWPVLQHIRNNNVMKHYTRVLLNDVLTQVSDRANHPDILKHLLRPIILQCVPKSNVKSNDNVFSSQRTIYLSSTATQLYINNLSYFLLESKEYETNQSDTKVITSTHFNNVLSKWFKRAVEVDDLMFFIYYWQRTLEAKQSQNQRTIVSNHILNTCVESGSINILKHIRDVMRLLPSTFPNLNQLKLAAKQCKDLNFFKWLQSCNPENDTDIEFDDLQTYDEIVQYSSFEICCHVLPMFTKFIATLKTNQNDTSRNNINQETYVINQWKIILKHILERCEECTQFSDLFTTITILQQNISRNNIFDVNFISECKNKSQWFKETFIHKLR